MFIDCISAKFHANQKRTWILFMILLPFIGAIVYYLAGRPLKLDKGR